MRHFLTVISFFSIFLTGCGDGIDKLSKPLTISNVLSDVDNDDFKKVLSPSPIEFPRDHGAHHDYKTEWWYVTGNLRDQTGRGFGYQLTFFRFGLTANSVTSTNPWVNNQVYMAHFALSDWQKKSFNAYERFSRAGLKLAGAQSSPFHVWLDDWKIEQLLESKTNDCTNCISLKLTASHGKDLINLNLESVKPVVLQGNKGFSQKSDEAGNASMYYSYTRLKSTGMVTTNGKTFAVNGYSWMDREWSTSALSSDQAGWDWFSLQLDDNSELMFYQLRHKDGDVDKFSSGSYIDAKGVKTNLKFADVGIEVIEHWRSERSRVRYPSAWRLSIPTRDLVLEVKPVLKNQELNLSFRYWEGAVSVAGHRGSTSVSGSGFVELAGYE